MWYVSNTDGYRMGTNVLVLIHLPNTVLIHVLVLIRITNTVVITVLVLIHAYRYVDTNTTLRTSTNTTFDTTFDTSVVVLIRITNESLIHVLVLIRDTIDTMKKESHRHHYIPQFILRNFSKRGDGFVEFYDLKKKTITNRPTEEIFLYNDLYRDENNKNDPTKIEDDLAKYENEIAQLFNKKIYKGSQIELTIEEEDKLKLFLTIMGLRNKKAKTVFGEDTDPRILAMYKPYLADNTLEDLWKKNLGVLVNCRSLQEVIDSKEIIDPFRHYVFLNTFGFFGTYLIIAERRGNEDFIIGDSYPSFQMAKTKDGLDLPMLNYYPISPDRVIILAVSDISNFQQSARQISETLFRKPTLINNGKALKYNVKKIYEDDVKFINSFAWMYARGGVAFIDENKVEIPTE